MPRISIPTRVAVRAVVLVGTVLAAIQLSGAVQPIDLAGAGQDGQGSRVVVQDFGRAEIRDAIPFDGQYLYVTARLLPDWDAINEEIHESSYRLVRILHPLLASPGGSGNPVLVLMQLWNLVGLGLLAWGLADVLRRHGFEASWAMAACAACALPILLTTSEPLAFGLGMAGLALVERDRLTWAIVPLALGGLTRESALTFAVAAAVLLLADGRRARSAGLLAAAAAPTAFWWAYVQTVTPPSRVPLAPMGILHLVDQWWVDALAATIALALIVVSVVAWWDVPTLRWLALAFAAWIPLYEAPAFKLVGVPRLSLPSIALGLAGLARWRARARADMPAGAATPG